MENSFPSSDLIYLNKLSNLQSLSLSGNKISCFDDIKLLDNLTNLIQLDLNNCKISEKNHYRKKIFQIFPNLQVFVL